MTACSIVNSLEPYHAIIIILYLVTVTMLLGLVNEVVLDKF
jgi:hypothetical protein